MLERSNADGFRFYAHQFYDGDGRKRERYLAGPIGAPEADAFARTVRLAIVDTKAASTSLRLLGREGFALADAKTYATLASLHNHGVFQAGGVLIGSHAYGLLLNQLGVVGARYATEDIDIARREKLAFPELPEASFLEMLQATGIPFVEVPQLDARQPSTSFKERGRSRFHVDLLVPSAGEDCQVVPVPELQAHATALPYLSYLLADSQMGLLMAREGCCMVRVPLPERFALHKLMVSQLRAQRGAKSEKDLFQARPRCVSPCSGRNTPVPSRRHCDGFPCPSWVVCRLQLARYGTFWRTITPVLGKNSTRNSRRSMRECNRRDCFLSLDAMGCRCSNVAAAALRHCQWKPAGRQPAHASTKITRREVER